MSVLGRLYDAAKQTKQAIDHGYPSPPPNSRPTAAPAPKAAAPAPTRKPATRPAIPVDAVPGGSALREGIRRRQRIMDEL